MPDAVIRVYSVVIQLFALEACRLENKKPYQNGRVGFPEWKGSFDRKNRYAEINVRGFTGFAVVGFAVVGFAVSGFGSPGSVYTRFSRLYAWAVWRFGCSMSRQCRVHIPVVPDDPYRGIGNLACRLFRIRSGISCPRKRVVPMTPGGYYSESFRTKVTPRSASSE